MRESEFRANAARAQYARIITTLVGYYRRDIHATASHGIGQVEVSGIHAVNTHMTDVSRVVHTTGTTRRRRAHNARRGYMRDYALLSCRQ